MKYTFILLALATVMLTSCSTAYRAAQTPDDVYYSPARENVEKYQAKANTTRDRYQESVTSEDDRFLRMKVRNPERWQNIDDYGYWYDSRYDYNIYNNGYYNRYAMNNWNPGYRYCSAFSPNYYGYGGYYTPSYPVVYYKNPKVYTGATGKSNLSTYMNTRYNNRNANFSKGSGENGFGNLVRKVLVPTNSNSNTSNTTYDRPARTSESTSAPSNSAGGRSGGYSSSGSSTSTPRPPRN